VDFRGETAWGLPAYRTRVESEGKRQVKPAAEDINNHPGQALGSYDLVTEILKESQIVNIDAPLPCHRVS
jgi:hypothetical protein